MASQTREPTAVLEELANLLATYGETYWEERIRQVLASFESGGGGGVEALLRLYESRGENLNELFLGPEEGHNIQMSEVGRANKHLAKLRSEAYGLARELQEQNPGMSAKDGETPQT